MEQELASLRRDTDILSRCGCSLQSPLEQRLKAVDQLKNQYKVSTICKTFKIAKSIYYNRKGREGKKNTYQLADEALKPKIQEIFVKSKESFDGAKIKVMLEKENIIVSPERVMRLMKEMELICKQARLVKAVVCCYFILSY